MTFQTVDPKDPDAVEPFSFDFSERFLELDRSERIDTFEVAIDDGDSSLLIDRSSMQGPIVTAWLSGGTLFATYTVRCRVVTTIGRTLDLSFKVTIQPD